jgi:uncharacterized protein (TIGR03032 family)
MTTALRGVDSQSLENLWTYHDREFRDPQQVVAQWQNTEEIDPSILEFEVKGDWWTALAATRQTLIVTREYEHLVMAFSVRNEKSTISYLRLPHPNGLAVDHGEGRLYVASTRNPNMIYEFLPCTGLETQRGTRKVHDSDGILLPDRCRYLPGCLYIHDIALIKRRLYANAVAMNAIIELPAAGGYKRVWWPRSIDGRGRPDFFDRNYIQLNSIAAGPSLRESFFSASAAAPSARRPGHLNFPVNRRGVIFAGKTRDIVATGLTRPHSARLVDGVLWVDNSGYGEVGRVVEGRYEAVTTLPGWTRGLCHCAGILFVGTSRVIPKFRHYAPGLNCDKSRTGLHAVELRSGRVLGSLYWPRGNQVFAIESMDTKQAGTFPITLGAKRSHARAQQIFFAARSGVRASEKDRIRTQRTTSFRESDRE